MSGEATEKFPVAEIPTDTNRGFEVQARAVEGLCVAEEADKSTDTAHDEANRSENGDISVEIDEGAAFELGIDDSKDLLSLNEELSNILDPKVGLSTLFNDPTSRHPPTPVVWGRAL